MLLLVCVSLQPLTAKKNLNTSLVFPKFVVCQWSWLYFVEFNNNGE